MTERKDQVTMASPQTVDGLPVLSSAAMGFCLPINERLETDRVLLVTFEPEKHGERFFNAVTETPSLIQWTPFGPWASAEEYKTYIHNRSIIDPEWALFAVFVKLPGSKSASRVTTYGTSSSTSLASDKPTPKTSIVSDTLAPFDSQGVDDDDEEGLEMAGMISLLSTSPQHASTEIGAVFTFPRWQRTFVTTHAVGLLLFECLTPACEGGLGLRRVQWKANSQNAASRRTAERLGFTLEGIMRWHLVLARNKADNVVGAENVARQAGSWGVKGWDSPSQSTPPPPARDSFFLSLCWDDWFLHGKRELVKSKMDR